MKYKTLFRIICKAIGVYLFIIGGSGALSGALAISIELVTLSRHPLAWYGYVGVLPALLQLAAGCYLFFDGRLIADWAIPGNRKYCPECGYDLNSSVSGICPECGTHAEVGRPD